MVTATEPNRTIAILEAASKGSYGVLAAIAYNVEQLTALVRAAEAVHSPLILLLFPSSLKQLPWLVWACSAASKKAAVPVSLHLDHATDEQQIREVVATMPFDSIMIDMSHYNHDENLRKTRELTELCHKHGIAVEAESGRITGDEDGISGTGDLEALFTTPSEVEDFLNAGVDMLAPSIGNIHGDYPPAGPKLQFDRLRSVGEQISGKAHLVLHGTNDFSPALLAECVAAGVTKLNVNKLLLESWSDHLKSHASDPIVKLIDDGMDVLQQTTEKWMRTRTMASLIIGAGIFGYVTMKERKAKKADKARQAEEAREVELQMQQRLADDYYGSNNDTRNQSEQFVAPPAYSEKLRRRSSSIYSQGSDNEAQRSQGGNA